LKNIINKNTLIAVLIGSVIFLVGTLFGSKNSQLFSKKTYSETCYEIIENGKKISEVYEDLRIYHSYTYKGKVARIDIDSNYCSYR